MKLETIRRKIGEMKARHREVERAPLPVEEIRERVRGWIAARAEKYRPGELRGFTHPVSGRVGGILGPEFLRDWRADSASQFEAMLCSLLPERVEAVLLARIVEEVGDREPGLPSAERAQRLAEIDRELFRLETEEEQFIEQFEAEGQDVVRREDANPAAVLGLPQEA